MSPSPKQPFDEMPGLPSHEDAELNELMTLASRMPRTALESIVCSLYRAALGYERTGDAAYLICLAEDALVTMRLRSDPEYEKALNDAPGRPARPDETLDLEEVLARHRP